MANISTIGDGQDYSTLALWEAAADDAASADEWAECIDDDTDLGKVDIAGWTAVPTSSLYPRIYTTLAERHDGTETDTGAYLSVSAGYGISVTNTNYVRVEGMRINCNSGTDGLGMITTTTNIDDFLFDSNMVVFDDAADFAIHISSINCDIDGTIQNNIVYGKFKGTSSNRRGIYSYLRESDAGTYTANLNIYNNTVHAIGGAGSTGRGIFFSEVDDGGTSTLNATVTNNIVTSSQTDDYSDSVTNGTITHSYNLSSDGTASGTGSLTLKAASGQYINTATNLALKHDADATNAGTTIGSFDWDALHLDADNWRTNQSNVWDMGALERYARPTSGTLGSMGCGV
jgi:hypothetical protein